MDTWNLILAGGRGGSTLRQDLWDWGSLGCGCIVNLAFQVFNLFISPNGSRWVIHSLLTLRWTFWTSVPFNQNPLRPLWNSVPVILSFIVSAQGWRPCVLVTSVFSCDVVALKHCDSSLSSPSVNLLILVPAAMQSDPAVRTSVPLMDIFPLLAYSRGFSAKRTMKWVKVN